MKALLLSVLVLPATAHAQVIECPRFYPSDNVALSDGISSKNGSGRLQRSRLSHATMYAGEIYGEQTMVPPGANKVGGSWDVEFDFTPQETSWLICTYGGSAWGDGNVQWWKKLGPQARHCVLKVREYKERPYPTRWTATATCK